MPPGPRPKPTVLKVLAGNPGKRPLPENEPMPARLDRLPNAPRYLNRHAQKEWRRIGPELIRLGLLTVADLAGFAAYCSAFGRWVQAELELKQDGRLVVYTDKGNPIQNPIVGIANRARADMLKAAAEFGLTPSARSRVMALGAPERSLTEILRRDLAVVQGGKRAHG